MGLKFLKHLLTYCPKYNEINLCHSDIQKHVSYEKWLYTGAHKSFPLHYYTTHGGILKRILANLYCNKCNEINIFRRYVQKHSSYTGSQ